MSLGHALALIERIPAMRAHRNLAMLPAMTYPHSNAAGAKDIAKRLERGAERLKTWIPMLTQAQIAARRKAYWAAFDAKIKAAAGGMNRPGKKRKRKAVA